MIAERQVAARHLAAGVRRAPTCAVAALLAASVAGAAGCGGKDEALLGSYLNQLEFDAPLEATSSVSLGRFDVPVLAAVSAPGAAKSVAMRIKFELVAETLPEHETAVQQAYERRRGALNDAVLRIVRTSSTDEFTDPRSSALKLRFNETVRPLLGPDIVRQLVLYEYRTEKL